MNNPLVVCKSDTVEVAAENANEPLLKDGAAAATTVLRKERLQRPTAPMNCRTAITIPHVPPHQVGRGTVTLAHVALPWNTNAKNRCANLMSRPSTR
jgi:hypothetical protein